MERCLNVLSARHLQYRLPLCGLHPLPLRHYVCQTLELFNMNSWAIEGRYNFPIPEAQWLSIQTGTGSDLEAVIRLCRRYMGEAEDL